MTGDGQRLSGDAGVEERMRVALAHAPIIIFSQDCELRYAWVYNPFPGMTAEDLLGRDDDDLFRPADAARLTAIKRAVIESGAGAREAVDVFLLGRTRRFDLLVEPLRDAEGNVDGIAGVALDITERAETEHALCTSEERYRAVSEILFGYVYSYRVEADFKMVLEWLSGDFEAITGVPVPEAGARGGWTMAINPDDRGIIRAKVRTLLSGSEDASEYRIFTRTGETRWVKDYSRPVTDESGRVTRIYGAIQDITELREAMDALRESEERFRRLSQAAVEGILVHEKGVVLDANESFAALVGSTVPEIIGQPIETFIAPESRETVREHVRAQSEETYEAVGLRRDGSTIIQEITGRKMPWYGREVRVAAVRDVTALRKAQEALRESGERYRALFMNDVSGNYLATADGVILLANPAFAAIFGFDAPEDAAGTRVEDLFVYREDWEEYIAGLRATGRRTGYEGPRRRRDGGIIHVIGNAAARYNERGEFTEITGYIFDITSRKRAEDSRQLNADRLEALQRLNQMGERPLPEITEFALEEAVRLTRSGIGYLAFLSEDETVATMHTWSRAAAAGCGMAGRPVEYPVAEMGLWGEAIRQRRAVITNDYAASNPLKRGCPEGHIPLTRHMNAPVFSGGRIVAVAGVGNKEEEYDDSDVRQLTLLMDGMWRLIERKRTVDALRAGEEKFRAVLENSVDAAYRRDLRTGVFDYMSPVIGRITGMTEAAFTALTDGEREERMHPFDRAAVREEMEAAARGERGTGVAEFRFRAADGEYRWLADNFTVIRDAAETPVYQVGVLRDITVQRFAEESLRESEARFRTLAEASSEGIVIHENETVLDANRRFAELFRYRIGEPAGMYLGEFFPPEYREQALRAMRGDTGRVHETVGERKDGVQVPLEIHGGTLPWYGRMVRVAAMRDISVRKEMERNLVRLRREYESFMRHELKNLFVPIQMHASILLEGGDDAFSPEQRLSLRRIRESAQRASGVIDSLKRIQDIEEGKYTLRLTRCSVRKLVREVIRELRPLAEQEGVTVLHAVRGGRTEVFADRDLLPGVFSNLLLNAIEHVADCTDPEDRIVRVTVHTEKGRVIVKIVNRGATIPPERLETFFEKFNVGPEKRRGLGLGTTYAWLITRAHGGDITVESNLWEGTTVTVILRPAGRPARQGGGA